MSKLVPATLFFKLQEKGFKPGSVENPTLQEVVDWLFSEKKIWIEIRLSVRGFWFQILHDIEEFGEGKKYRDFKIHENYYKLRKYPEQAILDAINKIIEDKLV